jgi:phosphoglycerate kinase
MKKLSVRDLEVKGRRVLVRVDFNVPTGESDGKIRITDDTRIRESLPTIEFLRAKGAKVVLLAHFGRPKGKPNLKYSLRPVADHLAEIIPPPVNFSPEVIGPSVEAVSKALPDSGVLLIENVRFFSEEEANANSFAQALAKLGDVYVNDAFGAAHRAHASTAGVAKYSPQAAIPDFVTGTKKLAEALVGSSAKTIIGGGDLVTAVKQFGLAGKMSFISTGGGASLELLEGKELPGVAALTDQ